jgi:K+-transporting ATPase ATPase A chain
MNTFGWIQLGLYVLVLLLLAKPLGGYMAAVYDGRASLAQRAGGWLERLIYKGAGVDASRDMDWKQYAIAMLWFNLIGALVVYGIQRLQAFLPLNPQDMAAVSPDSSFNTATSFITNTNWQGYGGESTMSYLTQMAALAVQNFVSAASGMATLVALVRAFVRKEVNGIGNFWSDLVRTTVYILLPLSLVFALVLVAQGVPQTFSKYATVTLTQPVTYDNPKNGPDGQPLKDDKGNPVTEKATANEQTIPLGPAASQVAIKQLGTNGGGFYNVNSAHPLENPTPLTNFLELLAILLIPAALCYTFGKMIGDTRQGWAILAAMTIVFVLLLIPAYIGEAGGNPLLAKLGVDNVATATNPGGNMEGKELRFGVPNSVLWATATTAASNGSVNSMHDSFMPLVGMIPMWLIQLGEVIFGGVGSGLYGMIVFAIVAVFIAGLMVGRTPEYLGKKIGAFEIKMASIAILIPPLLVLCGTALGVMVDAGKAGVSNPGEHGFSEILYAFSSASNNNGSAFAGLNANTPFYNTALGIVMLFARYWLAIPVLALAGAFAAAKRVPPSAGTLPTHTPLFVAVLIGTVITVGALTFVPALALGPVVEHYLLYAAAP